MHYCIASSVINSLPIEIEGIHALPYRPYDTDAQYERAFVYCAEKFLESLSIYQRVTTTVFTIVYP